MHAFHVGDEAICGAGLEEEHDEGDEGVEEEDCEAKDDEDEEDVEFLGDEVGGEGEAEVCRGVSLGGIWKFLDGGEGENGLQSESTIMRSMPDIVQCIAFRRSITLVIPEKQDSLDCVWTLCFFCLLGFFFF